MKNVTVLTVRLETIKILRIWQLRLAGLLLRFYNHDSVCAFFIRFRCLLPLQERCPVSQRDPCAKKTLRKSTFQDLIRNSPKSQLITPKSKQVRANPRQPGSCQSECHFHRVLVSLKKTFATWYLIWFWWFKKESQKILNFLVEKKWPNNRWVFFWIFFS